MLFALAVAVSPVNVRAQSYLGSQVCEISEPGRAPRSFPCKVYSDSSGNRIAKIVDIRSGSIYSAYPRGSQESFRQGAWVNHRQFDNCIKLNAGDASPNDDPELCTMWRGQKGNG